MSKFHEIQVADIERLTQNAVAISLAIPEALQDEFQFLPGQYLTIEVDIDGKPQRRSYSICSSVHDAHLKIGVKKVEQGLVSSFINDQLKVGDKLNLMQPDGRFTVSLGNQRRLLLLASGSGITPCLAIAKSVLEREPDSEITLVYGNRSVSSMMFRDELSDLKDTHTSRFSAFYLMSRESQDSSLLNGRLDAEKLKQFVSTGLLDVHSFDAAYLCGPQEMIEAASTYLQEAGMPAANIKFELFGTADKARKQKANQKSAHDGAFVDIILDGSQKKISIDGSTQTILTAAQSAGLDLPFSCAGGMCCTCRCKIIEGEAEMDVNYSLEDWEIEAGFTLACQARPKSKTLKLDFDAT